MLAEPQTGRVREVEQQTHLVVEDCRTVNNSTTYPILTHIGSLLNPPKQSWSRPWVAMATSTRLSQYITPYCPALNNWLLCIVAPSDTVPCSEWPFLTANGKDDASALL